MLQRVLVLLSICALVRSSGVAVAALGPAGPVAALGHPITANAPVVTAASSQYFERTFNRLVVPPVVAPAAPVAPPPLAPVFPVAPAPTVFINPVAVNPQALPPQEPVQPNIAIAVATAYAAAPVATILLPPYPFGFPPTFGFVPSEQPNNIPDENTKEPTTQRTTETEVATTPEPASTTPIDASSSDNNVVQALPSNDNVNYNLYGPPPKGSIPQFQPQPESQTPNGQLQPQNPNLQFQPQQPNSQFQPQRPSPQFQPQRPNPQFQPQRPNPQFQPQHQNTNVQFQTRNPNTQFQVQQPEFPPYPPRQQGHSQNQPQQRPQLQPLPQYGPPPQQLRPQQKGRPQKLKTSVEVVPVPLAYITPPPLHKTHAHVKVVKHIYSFVPASGAKIILKPVKIRPVRLVKHKIVRLQNLRAEDRDIEITTLNPFRRLNTKPPRV